MAVKEIAIQPVSQTLISIGLPRPDDYELLMNPQTIVALIYKKRQIIQLLNSPQSTLSRQLQPITAAMTPNARSSPRPLIVCPHLHGDSQCCSCSTVMPGDICFNCGRLGTLLVTPRPPRNLIENRTQATAGPVLAQERPVLRSRAFDSQYDRVETLVATRETPAKPCDQHHAFDSQFSEIEALLDARKKLARIHTLAASDTAILDHTAASSSHTRFTCSSGRFSNSSKARSTCFSGSRRCETFGEVFS